MKLLDLFIVAFIPVLKVLLLTALGLFLALDRVDILGKEARKHLNNVAFFVFNPALVASSLAKYITLKSISLLWFMPFNVLLTFIIGSALGWILLKITKAPSDLWGLVLGCCAAGNLGNLPLIIIPAVCKERGSPFGDAHTCYNQGMAYSALSMAIGAIYMWSYVYNIMRICSNKRSEGAKPDDFTESAKPAVETAENLSNSHLGSLLPLKSSSPREDHLDHLELDQANISEGKPKVPLLEKIKQFFQTFAMKTNLRKLFAPSTIGAVVGFLVGSIPQVRKVLIGDSASLRVVEDSASLLGDAAIPTVTIIMGANLLKGLKGSKIHLTLMIGILVIRYIALPIVGVVIVKLAIHLGLVKSNPLYQFVLLLQFALPPAVKSVISHEASY
ncbi:protein PIN-LIKES 1-like [Mangifera indica]|uniref:protein PIN-LIKES 1-like n=1 Tax=Mangifera indica TaxID=29780 RepID=UPI001CF9D33E|nr:protein PIN-LIKES 1-like [Mangifera indica]